MRSVYDTGGKKQFSIWNQKNSLVKKKSLASCVSLRNLPNLSKVPFSPP